MSSGLASNWKCLSDRTPARAKILNKKNVCYTAHERVAKEETKIGKSN